MINNLDTTLMATFSGPSGAGKSKLVSGLVDLGLNKIVNFTTRSPRSDDTDYEFGTDDMYHQIKAAGWFIAYRERDEGNYGLYYPKSGYANLAIVDPSGAKMIHDHRDVQSGVIRVVSFLLYVPKDECERRIIHDGADHKRIARLTDEFWSDGRYLVHPMESNFVALDGLLSADKVREAAIFHINSILKRGSV